MARKKKVVEFEKRNPVAKDLLTSGLYRQRVEVDRKKKARDSFHQSDLSDY